MKCTCQHTVEASTVIPPKPKPTLVGEIAGVTFLMLIICVVVYAGFAICDLLT